MNSIYLPLDVWRIISHHLSPYILSLNSTLLQLYNDIWFQEHLIIKYPNKNLWCRSSYKDLYKQFSKMGSISLIMSFGDKYTINPIQLPIRGIKICANDPKMTMKVLDFNGDLYQIKDFDNVSLLDKKVIDIDPLGYITESKWFYLKNDKYLKFKDTKHRTKSFIKVSSRIDNRHTYLYALTEDYLYIYKNFIDIIKIPFENAIDMYITNSIIVLQKDNKIFEIKFSGNKKNLLFTNGKELRGHAIFLNNNICYIRQYNIFGHSNQKIPLIDKIYFNSVFGEISLYKGMISIKTSNRDRRETDYNYIKDIFSSNAGYFFIIQ